MADWDADSPQLHQNLAKVRASIQRDARKRVVPTVAVAKVWQETMMAGLTVPDPLYVPPFRQRQWAQRARLGKPDPGALRHSACGSASAAPRERLWRCVRKGHERRLAADGSRLPRDGARSYSAPQCEPPHPAR